MGFVCDCPCCQYQGAFITFPKIRVETCFNTHNQNAFANAFRNAFLELLRLSSISQNHDYEYTVRPRKKKKRPLKQRDAVTKCRGV